MRNKFAKFAALAVCAGFASCSEYDAGIDPMSSYEIAYEAAFIKKFGQPAADQDWGFGSSETRAMTRATWTLDHDSHCMKSEFDIPNSVKALKDLYGTDEVVNVAEKGFDKNKKIYYVPDGFKGDLDLEWLGFAEGAKFYNYGDVESIKQVNYNGLTTIYNIGKMKGFWATGTRHTIINMGTFDVTDYANIGNLYNMGDGILFLRNADLPAAMSVYSDGDASVYLPNGAGSGDGLQCTLDIHGSMYVTGDMSIGNKESQYVCHLEVTGRLYLNKGHLQTSYVTADNIEFNGDKLYLLPGGYVKANSISLPNGGCYIYGESSSNALIEVGGIAFQNDNDFDRTFSDNIYFTITGSINFTGATNGSVKEKRLYSDLADYINANSGLSSNNRLYIDQDALEADGIGGNPVCGSAWGKQRTPDTPTKEDFIPKYRIIAEDLTVSDGSDFDFNDVVFDIAYSAEGNTCIILRAAGGTLPLRVGKYNKDNKNESWRDAVEVHGALGVSETTMFNTFNPDYKYKKLLTPWDGIVEREDIGVWVYKGGDWIELKAERAHAASKICVDPSYEWCKEREDILDIYPDFEKWVQDPNVKWY